MKKNQKGFSAVEALLIFVIVGLIGGVGWYAWQKKATSNNQANTTTNSNNSEQKPDQSKDPYTEWKTYKSLLSSGLTFRHPPEWLFTPPTEVFKNVHGGESLNVVFHSTEVQREPGGEGAPNPASNVYMCVSISEYGGEWLHSDWNLGSPTATEEFEVNGKKLTLATYKGEKPMLGKLVVLENGVKEVKTQNNYLVVAAADFNCGQADHETIEDMTDDFSQREETKTAKLMLKSISF